MIKEIIDIIEKLNAEIYEKVGEDLFNEFPYINLSLVTDGYAECVDFLGMTLWNSDNDEREYVGEGVFEDYEPLEGFIRKQVDVLINGLFKIIKKEKDIK